MQRVLTSLGLTTVRALMVFWGVSAVVLLIGLVLVVNGNSMGFVLFVLGVAATLFTAFGMLRVRAGERGDRRR